MKITILSGSPRRNGNSVYLARQFMKGAEEADTKCSSSTVPPITSTAVWDATIAG